MLGSPASRRPAAWPALLAYSCAFVLLVGADVAIASMTIAHGHAPGASGTTASPSLSFGQVVAITSTNAVILVAVAVAAAHAFGGVPAPLRAGASRATALGVLAAIAGTIGLSAAVGSTADLFGVVHRGSMDVVETAVEGAGYAKLAVAVLAIAILPGIAEETLFRGLMQTRLAAAWGRWPALSIASLAFGLLHLDAVQGPMAFVLGLFLGWCADRLGSIRPTIAAHAANNAIFVLAASFEGPGNAQRVSQIATLVAGGVACLAAIAVLRARVSITAAANPPGAAG